MLASLLLSALLGATPPTLHLQTLSGHEVARRSPVVLMFWRSDCGPCRLELGDLAALRRAAAPMAVRLVGLQAPKALAQGLRAGSLSEDSSLWTAQDAGEVLTSYGGPPPRLPLAVALDAQGRVCARRTGLLGTDQLKAWAIECGGRHALH